MSTEDDDDDYTILYPSVVCQSHGGPYQDESFVAGAYYGSLMSFFNYADKTESEADPDDTWDVPTPLIPQVDLLAMQHGYVLIVSPSTQEFFTAIRFVKVDL